LLPGSKSSVARLCDGIGSLKAASGITLLPARDENNEKNMKKDKLLPATLTISMAAGPLPRRL